jgi:hypothetical protein
MNPAVYFSVLKHIGINGFEQAILYHVVEELERHGYNVEYEIDEYDDELYHLEFSSKNIRVRVEVDYINEFIKLDTVAHVRGISDGFQESFFDEFPSLIEYRTHLLPLDLEAKKLLHIENVINLRSDVLSNIDQTVIKFTGLIDIITSVLSQKSVHLEFLSSDLGDWLEALPLSPSNLSEGGVA